MTVTVPAAVAVKDTEHVPALSVQLVGVNDPAAPVLVNETVPVGVGEVLEVTVAVHVEAWPITTGVVHDTVVVVGPAVTVTLAAPELVP